MDELARQQRRRIVKIARENGAERVRLFGSFAARRAGASSDVDLLVRLSAGRGLLDLVAIKQDVEEAIGRNVDVVTEAALSPHIREAVMREAILL